MTSSESRTEEKARSGLPASPHWAEVAPSVKMRLNFQRLPLSMGNQKGQFLLHVPRQVVIRAHQEQLDEMAELDFKEETLMAQMESDVSSHMSY